MNWYLIDHYLTHGRVRDLPATSRPAARRALRCLGWRSTSRVPPRRERCCERASGAAERLCRPGSTAPRRARELRRASRRRASAGGACSSRASTAPACRRRPSRSARRSAAYRCAGRGPTSTCSSSSSACPPGRSSPTRRARGSSSACSAAGSPMTCSIGRTSRSSTKRCSPRSTTRPCAASSSIHAHRIDGIDYDVLADAIPARPSTAELPLREASRRRARLSCPMVTSVNGRHVRPCRRRHDRAAARRTRQSCSMRAAYRRASATSRSSTTRTSPFARARSMRCSDRTAPGKTT